MVPGKPLETCGTTRLSLEYLENPIPPPSVHLLGCLLCASTSTRFLKINEDVYCLYYVVPGPFRIVPRRDSFVTA